jgi:hypothetical protein
MTVLALCIQKQMHVHKAEALVVTNNVAKKGHNCLQSYSTELLCSHRHTAVSEVLCSYDRHTAVSNVVKGCCEETHRKRRSRSCYPTCARKSMHDIRPNVLMFVCNAPKATRGRDQA